MTLPVESVWKVRQAIDDLLRAAERSNESSIAVDLRKMQKSTDNLLSLLEEVPRRLAETTQLEQSRRLRHDLRTPVNQIIGYCELIEEEAEDMDCSNPQGAGDYHDQKKDSIQDLLEEALLACE